MIDEQVMPRTRTPPRWSVRALLVGLVLAALLPGVIGTALLFVDEYRVRRAEFEHDTLQTARALVQTVDGRLLTLQAVAQTLGSSSELASGDLAGFHRRASELIRGTTIGTHFVLTDPNGQQLVNTLLPFGAALPISPVRSRLIELFARGQPFISDVVISAVTKKPTVALYVPVRLGGEIVYGLGVGIDPQQISQILIGQRLPDKWAAAAIDGAGTIAARTHGGDQFIGQTSDPQLLQRTRQAPEGSVFGVSREGIPIFMVFSRSPLTHWSVVIAIPSKLLDTELARTASLFAVGIGALFFAGIALAWLMGGRIARSVRALSGPASAMEFGDAVEVPAVHFREADEVATAMLRTARIVKQRNDTLAQASRALSWSEARLRGIFDSATDAILSVDEAQNIVMANPAAAKMFRCPVEQLVGSPVERLIPERHRPVQLKGSAIFSSDEFIGEPGGVLRDVVGLLADGGEFPVSAAVSKLSLGDQSLYTVILRDISARKAAEEALRASKAMLDAALSSMSDALLIVDGEGRLIRFNDAYVRFHRFSSREQCSAAYAGYGAVLDIFLASGDPASVDQWPSSRALRGETGSHVDYRLSRKDSGEAWTGSYSFAPIRFPDGTIVGAVISARDVTAFKQTQIELESAHATLRRLISAMDSIQENERRRIARELHDDLQQLLATIKVYAKGIADDWPADATRLPQSIAAVQQLADAANISVRRIINDLRPQILEHLGLVPALAVLAEQLLQNAGVPCSFEVDEEDEDGLRLPPAVTTCLYRVAQEALNNVVRHAQASAVEMRLSRTADGRVLLCVRDDGIGMKGVDRNKLQSFGLLGMQERLQAVGGTLRIDSQPGAGTTVEAAVPFSDAVEAPAP